jgi:hypothetical protein
VRDLVAHLTLVVNQRDEVALARALRSRPGVGQVAVARVLGASREKDGDLVATCLAAGDIRGLRGQQRLAVETFGRGLRELARTAERDRAGATCTEAALRSGLVERLRRERSEQAARGIPATHAEPGRRRQASGSPDLRGLPAQRLGGDPRGRRRGGHTQGAFSDALKRAAVAFGIGRFLYAMKSPWLDAGDGEHQLRRSRGAKPRLIIDRRTEAWLRERYAEWLARVAEEFGEPLGHGDEAGAPGLDGDPGKNREEERTDADGAASRPKWTLRRPRPAPAGAAEEGKLAEAPGRPELAYWQGKGRYGDETVRSLAAVVCGESKLEALTAQQFAELAFLLECAVRGRVTGRSLDSWLAQLAHRDDRRTAAEALRARLVEKTNEVELGGRREAA